MINLMPDEAKKQLRAARVNVLLVRYTIVVVFAFLFLIFILFGSYFLLTQTKDSAQQLVDANDTKAEVYNETKTQVNALSNKLAGAKTILDQETFYSKALINIGKLTPTGTVIDKIKLTASSFTGSTLTLQVYAKNTESAVKLRQNFQASPFFSNVSFQSISDSSGGITGYPVSATMTLSMNRTIAQ